MKRLQYIAWAAIAAACAVVAVVAWSRPITADAVESASVLSNLLDGRGLVVSVINWPHHLLIGTVPVPQTVFPPGQAVLALPFAWLGASPFASMKILATLGLAVGAATLFTLLSRMSHVAFAAVLTLAWLLNPLVLHVTGSGLSELPFAAMLLIALAAFPRNLATASAGRLSAVGVALSAAILIRYVGIIIVGTLLLYLLWSGRRSFDRQWLTRYALLALLPSITVTLLFARNLFYTGELSGGQFHVHETLPLTEALLLNAQALWAALGFSVIEHRPVARLLLSALVLAAFVTAVVLGMKRSVHDRATDASLRSKFAFIALCTGFVFFTLNTALTGAWFASPRYYLILVPMYLLVLASMALPAGYAPKLTATWQARVPQLLLALGTFSLLLTSGYGFAASLLRGAPPSTFVTLPTALDAQCAGTTVRALVEIEARATRPVLTTVPHSLYYATQVTTIGLPHRRFSGVDFDEQDVRKLIEGLGPRLVLLYAVADYPTDAPYADNEFFRDIVAGALPNYVTPLCRSTQFFVATINLAS